MMEEREGNIERGRKAHPMIGWRVLSISINSLCWAFMSVGGSHASHSVDSHTPSPHRPTHTPLNNTLIPMSYLDHFSVSIFSLVCHSFSMPPSMGGRCHINSQLSSFILCVYTLRSLSQIINTLGGARRFCRGREILLILEEGPSWILSGGEDGGGGGEGGRPDFLQQATSLSYTLEREGKFRLFSLWEDGTLSQGGRRNMPLSTSAIYPFFQEVWIQHSLCL